jgi:hypothetical protein
MLFAFGLVIATIAEISHEPGHLLRPELWAEDGVLWISEAYNHGLRSLIVPEVGYLQTFSRLAALFAIMLPMTLVPCCFAIISLIVQILPIALLLSNRGKILVKSNVVRFILIAFYVGEPNASEVYMNLTNSMWHLGLVAFMLIVLPKPLSSRGLVIDIVLLILSGLSGPLVLFTAPIACWQARTDSAINRKLNWLYASILSFCALIQLGYLLKVGHASRLWNLGVAAGRALHIATNQIFAGGIIGASHVAALMSRPWWVSAYSALVITFVGCGLVAVAWAQGPTPYRQFALFCALIFLTALISPMVSSTVPQWLAMETPGAGDRYYVIPILGWFVTLLVLACQQSNSIPWRIIKWAARGIALASIFGVVADWNYPPYAPTNFHQIAKAFDHAAAGQVMIFPENPVVWYFKLTKH